MNDASAPTRTWTRRLWRLSRPVLIALGVVVIGLLLFQRHLIYLPARYSAKRLAELPRDLVRIPFRTDQGDQLAFYRPPSDGAAPDRVWLLCGGNASTALSWLSFVRDCPDPRAGYLLVDFPGYGACAGSATPTTIADSTCAAATALAAHLHLTDEALSARTAVLGHSLGCAAVLQYAATHRVQRIVLVAPFTRMLDMARRRVGWPLCHLLHHRFDNRARLAELTAAGLPPTVIIHGAADEVIPAAMGRALAAEFPAIRHHELPGIHHNDVFDEATDEIHRAMSGDIR